MGAEQTSPFLIDREIQEAAFISLSIVPKQIFHDLPGQMWQASDGQGDGPSFVLQWFGEKQQYFDSQQVQQHLIDIADWRSRNPPKRAH